MRKGFTKQPFKHTHKNKNNSQAFYRDDSMKVRREK